MDNLYKNNELIQVSMTFKNNLHIHNLITTIKTTPDNYMYYMHTLQI